MSLPICEKCAKSNVLCSICEEKLAEKLINEFDIEVSRALHSILEDKAHFKRAIDTRDYVLIITSSDNVGEVIGEGGANLSRISSIIGRPARVVSEGDFEETVKAFIAPARVKGINTVYKPGKDKSIRIRLKRQHMHLMRINPEDMCKLLSSICRLPCEIVFD